MKKPEITQKTFNKLLKWLDKDKEVAARKYQLIHYRLVQFFLAHKTFPAEELADQSIDIAIQKIDYLIKEFKGEPAMFFYSVAQNLALEQARKPRNEDLTEKSETALPESPEPGKEDPRLDCLRQCMENLSLKKKRLLIKYFDYSSEKKISHHKKISKKLGISVTALRAKIYRIKSDVEKCVKVCIKKNNV